MTEKFLVATDGSKCSRRIVDYCVDHFTPDRAEFLVTHVIQLSPSYIEAYELTDPRLEHYRQQAREQAEGIIEEIQMPLEQEGFNTESDIRFGKPGVEILELAERMDVMGILMGRRGHSHLEEMLVGSTSHYLMHHANRPVILVPVNY